MVDKGFVLLIILHTVIPAYIFMNISTNTHFGTHKYMRSDLKLLA